MTHGYLTRLRNSRGVTKRGLAAQDRQQPPNQSVPPLRSLPGCSPYGLWQKTRQMRQNGRQHRTRRQLSTKRVSVNEPIDSQSRRPSCYAAPGPLVSRFLVKHLRGTNALTLMLH